MITTLFLGFVALMAAVVVALSARYLNGRTAFVTGLYAQTAQKIAAHESPRTTKLYDRTDDQLTLDEIEKISV